MSKYKYKFTLSIGLAVCDRTDEFTPVDWGWDDEEWENISDEDRSTILEDENKEWANQYIEYSFEPV
jgi:hypothetical protein